MFYLTLPSNSSMNYYPENTLAHYTTVLAQDVDLSGRWEVGLSEIQYPYSLHNINDYAGWIIVHKDHQRKWIYPQDNMIPENSSLQDSINYSALYHPLTQLEI